MREVVMAVPWQLRMPRPLLERARALSRQTDFPVSQLVRDGLLAQLERCEARNANERIPVTGA